MRDELNTVIIIIQLVCGVVAVLFGPIAPYFWAWWIKKRSRPRDTENGNATNIPVQQDNRDANIQENIQDTLADIQGKVNEIYELLKPEPQVGD